MQSTTESYQNRLIKNFNIAHKRYLFKDIDFSYNLIGIIGARELVRLLCLYNDF
ncbi:MULTISPECIES: hypothetical protein [Helicobacter]|uniref:hypothetical protein n=1 Tax=Helicobacter TaxID=209 RepID=UPI001CC1F8A3|nr:MULTISPECIES: hypothetical protein [Helicobacter]